MEALIPIVTVFLMLGTGIAIIATVGLALAAVGVARDERRRDAHRGVRLFMQLFGWSLIGVGLLGVLGVIAILAMVVFLQMLPFELVYGAMVLSILAGVFVLAGFLEISLAPRLGAGRSLEEAARVERKLYVLRFLGWSLVLVPACALLLPMVIPPLLIGLAVVVWLGSRRRARQGTLLWLLAIAVERGLPLAEEILALAGGQWGRHRDQLNHLADLLRTGLPLADALEHVPGVVPHFAVVAAHVGAENGTLAESLREAAVRHTQQQVWWGTSSPTLLVFYLLIVPTIAVQIVAFQMYYIIPKFKDIFEDFAVELPHLTRQLIHVSDFAAEYLLLLSPVWALPMTAMILAAVGYVRGWGEFDIPLLSRWFTRYDTPAILRNLAETMAAGRPLDDVLPLLAARHRRQHIQKRINEVYRTVEGGGDCWQAMNHVGLIKPREAALLTAAERVGNLPWTLRELADAIERRRSYRWLTLLEFVQPIIVIGIALWVFFVTVAMFLPLIKLLQETVID